MDQFIQLLKTIDTSLHYYLGEFGAAIYVLLFLIVYFKTSLVVLTFLPGDSLVFAGGTLAATGDLELEFLFLLMLAATATGDSQNFMIGRTIGRVSSGRKSLPPLITEKTITSARAFLDSYGKVAIASSRFVPLMRTSVPFVAGYTGFAYRIFWTHNFIGGILWSGIWLGAGYSLGNLQWVEEHLVLSLMIVSTFSIMTAAFGFRNQYKKNHQAMH